MEQRPQRTREPSDDNNVFEFPQVRGHEWVTLSDSDHPGTDAEGNPLWVKFMCRPVREEDVFVHDCTGCDPDADDMDITPEEEEECPCSVAYVSTPYRLEKDNRGRILKTRIVPILDTQPVQRVERPRQPQPSSAPLMPEAGNSLRQHPLGGKAPPVSTAMAPSEAQVGAPDKVISQSASNNMAPTPFNNVRRQNPPSA